MAKVSDVFEKYITFPRKEKIYYRFIVDGHWMIDEAAPQEADAIGGLNNVLLPDRIVQGDFSLQDYQYKPLDFDTHEIRLLRMDWTSSEDSEVSYSLEHASLIDPGSYIAVSYCWGDLTTTHRIRLEEGIIRITSNLHSALRAVRNLKFKSEHNAITRLWVDAICINQTDGQERSQQIRNMRQIYAKAEEVVACVGPFGGEVVSEGTIACLSTIRGWAYSSNLTDDQREKKLEATRKRMNSSPLQRFELTLQDSITKQEKRARVQEAEALAREKSAIRASRNRSAPENLEAVWMEEDLKEFNLFFSQPYWKRVWVIQELTVGSKVTVLYGGLEFTWNDVATFFSMLKRAAPSIGGAQDGWLGPEHLVEFRDRFVVKRKPIGLLEALNLSRGTLATDPRDKIFALLGLCHDWSTFVPVPNYKQPLESIMADMNKTLMTFNKSLDLVCIKGISSLGEEMLDMPTWGPNWLRIWTGTTTIQEDSLLQQQRTCNSNPVLASSTNRVLKVRGARVGAVTNLTSAMNPYDKAITTSQTRISWISHPGRLYDKFLELRCPTPEMVRVHSTIWKTLTMSRLIKESLKPSTKHCFGFLWMPEGRGSIQDLRLIEWIDHNAFFKIGKWTLREWSQTNIHKADIQATTPQTMRDWPNEDALPLKPPKPESSDFEVSIKALHKVLGSGMRLGCLDADENFVLMVHPDVREGDEVFILNGCNSPIALRNSSDLNACRYMVIGGAYWDPLQKWEPASESMQDLTLY